MRVASLPIIKTFSLDSDPEKLAEVDIRQATYGDNRQHDELFKTTRTLYNAKGTVIGTEQDLNWREIAAKRICLTLAGARNITNEEGKELFTFNNQRPTSEAEFRRCLDTLPDDFVGEIHSKVIEVNPQWRTVGN